MKKKLAFQLSIKAKLIICFTLVLLLPMLSLGFFSFTVAKEELKNEVEEAAQEDVETVQNIITEYIEPRMKDIDLLSLHIPSILNENKYEFIEQNEEVKQLLTNYINLHPEIANIRVATADKHMLTVPEVKLPEGFDPTVRPWYQIAVTNKGNASLSDTYLSAAKDAGMIVSISKELGDGTSVLALDLKLSNINDISNNISIGEQGYIFITDKQKSFVVHPTLELGSKLDEKFINDLYNAPEGKYEYVFDESKKELFYSTNELTGWKVVGSINISEFSKNAAPILQSMTVNVIIALIISAVFVFFIIRSIIVPLNRLIEGSQRIASGDLSCDVEVKGNDEFGKLSTSFNEMNQSLRQLISEVRVASDSVASSSEQLTASSEETTSSASQLASLITDVAHGASSTVQSSAETSNAMEEMAKGVQQVAMTTATISEASIDASIKAKEGNESLGRAKDQMSYISDSVSETSSIIHKLGARSTDIANIVKVITDISNKTNLLALNASIEAARAGEAGKGFAVVATEIKKLAEQSQHSADEITKITQEISLETEQAVAAMEKSTIEVNSGIEIVDVAGEAFYVIFNTIDSLAAQIQEISAIAEEMSAGTEQVSASAQEISTAASQSSDMLQNAAAVTEEQTAAMEEIASSASNLSHMALQLQELVSKFKV